MAKRKVAREFKRCDSCQRKLEALELAADALKLLLQDAKGRTPRDQFAVSKGTLAVLFAAEDALRREGVEG